MSDLNSLEQEVAALNRTESNDFEFMDAVDHIEAAAKTTDANVTKLRDILNRFRLKLPNRETLAADRLRAKDLADSLMLATLKKRLARINARNEAMTKLTGELQTQIDKGNKDAKLLGQVKQAVDKATKTVTEAKALVDKLTATDAPTKSKLKALIDALGNVSSIFKPGTA